MPTLFLDPFCVFSQQVRLLVELQGLDIDRIAVDLRDLPDDFVDHYGTQVPVLETDDDDDDLLTDTRAILTHLDRRHWWPRPDTHLRHLVDDRLVQTFGAAFFAPEPQRPAGRDAFAEVLVALDELIDPAGPWFTGAEPSGADVIALPVLVRGPGVEALTGFPWSSGPWPRVRAWAEEMVGSPLWQRMGLTEADQRAWLAYRMDRAARRA